ncbi:amino acid ABC transporter [Acetobacter tropicalis NRIC 0312]|uniref:GABA permease n=1 Tax=Acetobacter tropicalis TaxID=104102 RepID=A0A511FQQ2_9PROT|nr:amino acid permease [Acetobacter tropicalis]GAL97216.1 amino acid/polyamine transporter [Acetobacter tropicalis]GBR69378.1 amino acid ABC transporter [Acetobacter tropicalis NRIC 0312]GEL51286.1 GABA permease [Acetobacter tropicalis]
MNSQTSKTELAQSLRPRHITMISLGGVIGAGLFIGSSGAILTAGPSVLISYFLSGLIVFLVNIMLRDIALHAPGHGSFISQICHALGPLPGFVAGWVYWVVWVTTLGVEVIASASLLAPYVPLPYAVIEIAILGVMTAINLLSVKNYGECEYWFALIKVIAICIFVALGIGLLGTSSVPVKDNVLGHGGFMPLGAFAFLAAVPTVLFSMTGSEIATIAALESDSPDRNIARVTRTVALRLLVFYLSSISLILCLIPWSDAVRGVSPFLMTLQHFHVPYASTVMTVVILSATLSTLNSGLYATSRVVYEMARRGDAPRALQVMSPKAHLPRRAVLASSAVALIVSATAVLSPGIVFAFLVATTGAFIMFYNIMIVCARLRLYQTGAWKGWLAIFLLAAVLLSMLLVPETRHELAVGTAALVLITLGGWIKLSRTHVAAGAGE